MGTLVRALVAFVVGMFAIWWVGFRVTEKDVTLSAMWEIVAPGVGLNLAATEDVRLYFAEYPGYFEGCPCPDLAAHLRQRQNAEVPVTYYVQRRGWRVENFYVKQIGELEHPQMLGSMYSGMHGNVGPGLFGAELFRRTRQAKDTK